MAGFTFMPNTATIVITETDDQLQIRVEYDPIPIHGDPPNHAALAANHMIQLFRKSQGEDAVISNTIYDARTGETFTETKTPT